MGSFLVLALAVLGCFLNFGQVFANRFYKGNISILKTSGIIGLGQNHNFLGLNFICEKSRVKYGLTYGVPVYKVDIPENCEVN